MDNKRIGIILAAGRGKRLKELSDNKPKPMVKVNNVPIINNLVEAMIENSFTTIVVVVGYKAELLEEHLKEFKKRVNLVFIHNEVYNTTNNIYSLWLANRYMEDGFFLFEADVFCDKKIIKEIVSIKRENVMLIDKFTKDMNGTVVNCDCGNKVENMYLKRDQHIEFEYSNKYKTVNFYKIGMDFYQKFFKQKLDEYIRKEDLSCYYEVIIKSGLENGYEFFGLKTGNNKWWEIDTKLDLRKAEGIFK